MLQARTARDISSPSCFWRSRLEWPPAFAGERTFNSFPLDPRYPANYASTTGYDRAAMRSDVTRNAQHAVEMKKATIAFGSLGLFLGVAMGALGGLSRGSLGRGLLGVLVGGASGAVTGAGL
jgi:hypothetical protein